MPKETSFTSGHGRGSYLRGSENYGQTKTTSKREGSKVVEYENRTTEDKIREEMYSSGRVVQRYADKVVVIEADGTKREYKRKFNPSEKIVQDRLDIVTDRLKTISSENPETNEALTESKAEAFMGSDISKLSDEELFAQIQIGQELKVQIQAILRKRQIYQNELEKLKNSSDYFNAQRELSRLQSELNKVNSSILGKTRGIFGLADDKKQQLETQISQIEYGDGFNGVMKWIKYREADIRNIDSTLNSFTNYNSFNRSPLDSKLTVEQRQKELIDAYFERIQQQLLTETMESKDYSEVLQTLFRRIEKTLTEEEQERGDSSFPVGEVELSQSEIEDALKQITVYVAEFKTNSGRRDTQSNSLYEGVNPSLSNLLETKSLDLNINPNNFRQVSLLLPHLIINKQAAYMYGGQEVLQQVYNQIRDKSVNDVIHKRSSGDDYNESLELLKNFKDPVSVSNYIFDALLSGDVNSLIEYLRDLKPEQRVGLKDLSGIKELSELLKKISKSEEKNLDAYQKEVSTIISLLIPQILGPDSKVKLDPVLMRYFNSMLHPEYNRSNYYEYYPSNPSKEHTGESLCNLRSNINTFTLNILNSSLENPSVILDYIDLVVEEFDKNALPSIKVLEQYLCLIDNLSDNELKKYPQLLNISQKLVDINSTLVNTQFNHYFSDPRYWRLVNLVLTYSNSENTNIFPTAFMLSLQSRTPVIYRARVTDSVYSFFERIASPSGDNFFSKQYDSAIFHLIPVGCFIDLSSTANSDKFMIMINKFTKSPESNSIRPPYVPFAKDFITSYLPKKGELTVDQVYTALVNSAKFLDEINNSRLIIDQKITDIDKYNEIKDKYLKM